MDKIIARTEQLLNTESIYKNQALEIDDSFQPKTMNLDSIDKEFMILSKEVEYALQPLKSRILHPEKCIEKKIPLKFGALLAGIYGTGKTLLAFKLAKEAIQNDWTFVYLKDPTLLARTLRLCKTLDNNGVGIIVFLEDIDQVTRGNRDTAMQDILNTLDGGDTKNMNVISIFTTNHIELIEPTFLRGKRIGSVITLNCLDKNTANAFLHHTFNKETGYTIDKDKDLDEVCQYIADNSIAPAFMAEIVESVKSNLIFAESTHVKAEYIQFAVKSYLYQVGLSAKKDMTETAEQKFAEGFADMITGNKMRVAIRHELGEELEARL